MVCLRTYSTDTHTHTPYEKLCYFKSLVITAYGAIIIWMRTTLYYAALKLIILDKNYDYANICINMCGGIYTIRVYHVNCGNINFT